MAGRNIFRGVNSIKFHNRFKDDNDCLIYLSEIKWADGYKCKGCDNGKFGKGKILKTDVVQNVDTMKVLL